MKLYGWGYDSLPYIVKRIKKLKENRFNYYNTPYPTIGELIKNKNYDYVSYRVMFPGADNYGEFAGEFKVEDGKIIPLDMDYYGYNEEVIASEEWTDTESNIKNGLTIIVECDMIQ